MEKLNRLVSILTSGLKRFVENFLTIKDSNLLVKVFLQDQIYEAGRGANKPHTYKIDIKTSDGYDSTAGTDDDVFIKIQEIWFNLSKKSENLFDRKYEYILVIVKTIEG